MRAAHTPVMLTEAIRLLGIRPGMRVVDATMGCGGHAAAMAERIGPGGLLIGIEWDGEALSLARERLAGLECDIRLHRRNFTELKSILAEEGLREADALLFDLGVSSLQLADGARGFSFGLAGPLDMRMDRRRRRTAADLLKRLSARELGRIFREYGEEPLAAAVAREIARKGPPAGTRELAEIISRLYRRTGRKTRINAATRVFQALRIAVNEELENLREVMPRAVEVAAPGARIAVISFHSLEDRIVKREFAGRARGCICPPGLPVCRCGRVAELRIVTKKPVLPSREEIERNPRARSARLRVAERI